SGSASPKPKAEHAASRFQRHHRHFIFRADSCASQGHRPDRFSHVSEFTSAEPAAGPAAVSAVAAADSGAGPAVQTKRAIDSGAGPTAGAECAATASAQTFATC